VREEGRGGAEKKNWQVSYTDNLDAKKDLSWNRGNNTARIEWGDGQEKDVKTKAAEGTTAVLSVSRSLGSEIGKSPRGKYRECGAD